METPILETPTASKRMGRDPFAPKATKTSRVLKTGEGRPSASAKTDSAHTAETSPALLWFESQFALPLKGVRLGLKSWLVARYLLTHREEWRLA